MWNRVALMVSGVAFGWSLVHYASAAPARQRTFFWRMLVALAVGLLFIVWLGVASATAGAVAAFVFILSAWVAYAANAKQVNKPPERESLERPLAPLEGQQGAALLLVLPGEPRTYDGPAHWAQRLRNGEAAGQPIPHWFVRPWAYGRIRRAYQRMGGQNPQRNALDALLGQLKPRLPQFVFVGDAYLDSAPTLAQELVRLGQQGTKHILLAPVGFASDPADALRDEVTRTRVREIGVQVDIAPSLEARLWPLEPSETALDRLLLGEPLPSPIPSNEQQLVELAAALDRRVSPGTLPV